LATLSAVDTAATTATTSDFGRIADVNQNDNDNSNNNDDDDGDDHGDVDDHVGDDDGDDDNGAAVLTNEHNDDDDDDGGDHDDDDDDDGDDDDENVDDDDDDDDIQGEDAEPSLSNLKPMLFEKIMSYLPLKDVLSVGEASTTLRVRATSNTLWLALIERAGVFISFLCFFFLFFLLTFFFLACARCVRCFRWARTVDEKYEPGDSEQFYKQFFALKYLRCIDVGDRRVYVAKTMSKRCVFCSERAAP
jgi:hypothetical protein